MSDTLLEVTTEDGAVELLNFDDPDQDGIEVEHHGSYVRIKNGITMDTGSAAFVMPTHWLPMFKLEPSEGAAKGQNCVGATGTVVKNEGQLTVKFLTKDKASRQMTFQCAPVNKMLASMSGVADAGNAILFEADGGHILKLDEPTRKAIRELVENCKTKTAFDRKGNVYVLDAYVFVPPNSNLAQRVDAVTTKRAGSEGFTRPEGK